MDHKNAEYYKKNWFSDRHTSLLNMVFNVSDDMVTPDNVLQSGVIKSDQLYPSLFGIYILNDLTILLVIMLLSEGYNTLGCKTYYLQNNKKFWIFSQMSLFFVIYFMISMPFAESMPAFGKVIPPMWTLLLTIIVWLLSNICARLGEDFAFYKPFWWPTPLTWYGFLGQVLTGLYLISEYYNYYYYKDANSQIAILLEYVLLISYTIIIGGVVYLFSKNFHKEVIKGGKSLTRFFFNLDTRDCNSNKTEFKKYDKELGL